VKGERLKVKGKKLRSWEAGKLGRTEGKRVRRSEGEKLEVGSWNAEVGKRIKIDLITFPNQPVN